MTNTFISLKILHVAIIDNRFVNFEFFVEDMYLLPCVIVNNTSLSIYLFLCIKIIMRQKIKVIMTYSRCYFINRRKLYT